MYSLNGMVVYTFVCALEKFQNVNLHLESFTKIVVKIAIKHSNIFQFCSISQRSYKYSNFYDDIFLSVLFDNL